VRLAVAVYVDITLVPIFSPIVVEGKRIGEPLQHDMIREIYEQPKAVADTLDAAFPEAKRTIDLLDVSKLGMVYFTGSGTSYHACLAANYALSSLTRVFSTNLPASEFSSWVKQDLRPKSLLVAISQSGESSDVLAAARAGAAARMRTIGVTNTPGSSLTKATEFQLVSTAGEEKAVTATKTYTATLAATYALVLELSRRVASETGRYERLANSLTEAPNQMQQTIRLSDGPVRELAGKFMDKEFYFLLGSGANYSTALEGALKLKESCNVYAEGFATREFLHGPIQLVDARTPVFLLRDYDEGDNVSGLEAGFLRFGAPTTVIGRQGGISGTESTYVFGVPASIEEVFSPLTYVIPLQLYAYYLSLARGLNPDRPEKLSKVVR